MADRSPVVQRLADLQAAAGQSHLPVAQLEEIGPNGANYTPERCGIDFVKNHLAGDKAAARQKTLNRGDGGGYGMDNTVLLHSEQEIIDKVLKVDMSACTWIGSSRGSDQYKVPINCTFITLTAREGGSGNRQISREGDVTTGIVNLKVYFNETGKTFKISGVESVG